MSLDSSRDETATQPDLPDNGQTALPGFTRRQKPPSLTRCSGCANTWTGLLSCHCGACHVTFTGITAFDAHRVGGVCNDPASLLTKTGEPRLIEVTKTHWSGWGRPGEGWVPE